jgi:SNF2 family DNA or RNA helicase
LAFDKSVAGITYSLFLQNELSVFEPNQHRILIILDSPAWIVFDNQLGQIEAINSKKITPFLNNKSIEIPSKNIPEFFERFIKDIVKKVDIEANGFQVVSKNSIQSCQLALVHDFFKNQYFINLFFDYGGYTFDNTKSKKTHSEIDLTDIQNIKVVQYKRNPEESFFVNKLLELGLEINESDLFCNSESNKIDPYHHVQWFIDNKLRLEEFGFSFDALKIEGRKLIAETATIFQTNDLSFDWFDIKMTITLGSYNFNFAEIIPNLKSQNRLFELTDNSIFLIPLEWFSTYSTFVKLVKIDEGLLKLSKNNFSVLENLTSETVLLNATSKIDYKPSPLLKTQLRPYQVEGVQWLLDHFNMGLGACLADDMGLGKTLQTLALLVAVYEQLDSSSSDPVALDLFQTAIQGSKENLKALIVLPSSLIFNWYNEAKKFSPHFSKLQYIGTDRKQLAKKLDRYDLIFTSYAILSRDIAVFEKYNFRYLILDESQYIKNKNSKVFKAISLIQAENKISLSGTPIENSLDDLWSQMQFINPNILGTFQHFNENYKLPIQKFKDEAALQELKTLIHPFILRRTKEQVLKDLPELIEQVFYCDMEAAQAKLYEEEKSKARNYLLNNEEQNIGKIHIINSLMRLRQLSNHPKMIDFNSEIDSGKYVAVVHYLQNLINANQKTIVFSSFVSNLAFYTRWCNENKIDYCELTGATAPKDREIAVNRFQTEEKPLLFFISLKAGGVGLNITKASYVLFLDPWWNPFAEKQGIGRAHRIGQEKKVTAIRFITKNTVEEKILQLQENKKLLSDSLLDEQNISPEIEANLDFILE